MTRPRKSALKQKATEPKIDVENEMIEKKPLFEVKNNKGETVFAVNEEVPESEREVIDEKLKGLADDNQPQHEIPTVDEIEEELPEVVFTNDPIEINPLDEEAEDEAEDEVDPTYEEKLARFLNNKTSSPYRLYLRTGILPKL